MRGDSRAVRSGRARSRRAGDRGRPGRRRAAATARRVFAPILIGAALTGCRAETANRSVTPAAARAAREAIEERYDQPDAAEAYYRAKRQPLDPAIDPLRAYELAEAQRRRMPRHALAREAAEATAAAAGAMAGEAMGTLPTWESLGPGNVGGRLRGFVIDPADPQTMYVAGVSGGVWKTTDGGWSWATATDQLANTAFNSLVMHPTDRNVLYGGTGEGYFREEVRGTGLPLRGAGVFVTRDAAATWSRLPSTDSEDFYWVNDLVISRIDPSRIYAATRTGVWRSLDEGSSWTRVLATAAKGGCLDLAARPDTATDFIFASCGTLDQATVYRCRAAEGTAAWEPVLSEPGMGRTSLAIAPADPRVVYALAASNVPLGTNPYDQGLFAVFRSSAEGAAGSWSARVRGNDGNPLNNLLLTNPIAANSVRCRLDTTDVIVNMGWYCNVIAVDPVDANVVWVGSVDLFRSADGGRTWGLASYWWADPGQPSYAHADHHNIVFHPAYNGAGNQTMFTACDGGVFRTDNARAAVGSAAQDLCDPSRSRVVFTALNHTLGVTQFYHGAVFPGAARFLGGTQDNGTVLGSVRSGPDGWRGIYGGDGGYAAIDPDDPSVVYVQSQGFDLEKSTDGGRTFASSRAGIAPGETFLFIAPLATDPNDPHTLWTGGRRLWRSRNGAALWVAASSISDDLSRTSAVAIAPGHSERVVAGTDSGRILRSDTALSDGASTTWTQSQPRPGFVTSVAFDPGDVDVVYATYGGFGGAHLYRSRDGGRTFASLGDTGPSSIPDVPAHCVLVDPGRRTRLFLGTDVGVLLSDDGGESWAAENTGFATAVTEFLTLAAGDDGWRYLFAFTHGRGAWRVKLPAAVPDGSHRPRRHLASNQGS